MFITQCPILVDIMETSDGPCCHCFEWEVEKKGHTQCST